MKAVLGVVGYGGNYRSRRQRTGPELYGGPFCDCCFFLSTPATLIAGLMEGSNKSASVRGEKKKKNMLLFFNLRVSVYVCERRRSAYVFN